MTLLGQARNYYSCSRANDKIMPSMPELMEAFAESVMPKWTPEKPDFACVFVGKRKGDYSLWQFVWNQGEAPDGADDDIFHYYLSWCTGDGEDEYDDIAECEFDEYLVVAKLPTMDEVHSQVVEQLKASYF